MKHKIQVTAPFVATVNDETELGKRAMSLYNEDPVVFAKLMVASALLSVEFDTYMAKMNERTDDQPHAIFLELDKPAFL